MCTDRGEEESQWESVPGTGACLLPGTPVSGAFYSGGHKAPVSYVHSPDLFASVKRGRLPTGISRTGQL